MIAYALLGVAVLVGVVLILRWFVSADPKLLVRAGKWLVLGGISVLAVVLAVSGRLQWVFGMAMALLPWLMPVLRGLRTAKTYRRMAGSGSGRTSSVRTRFLDMALDHDSGDLDGEVRDGPYAGSRLGDLPLEDLLDLLSACRREDVQSVQILEAYLDRAHPRWRDSADDEGAQAGPRQGESRGGGGGARSGARDMSRDEAYEILGLQPGASEGEIKAAYHRLITNLHPDKGGSNYLAAKINQAKQVLLGR